jgi:hypothetical protein
MRKRILGNTSNNIFKKVIQLEKSIQKLVKVLSKKGILKEEDLK